VIRRGCVPPWLEDSSVMSIFWMGLIGLCVLYTAIVCRLSARPPRCPLCKIAAEPVSEALLHSYPMVLKMAYRCPHCGQVIWRLFVGDVAA